VDKNPKRWNEMIGNCKIYAPEDIAGIDPDIVVITMLQKDYAVPFLWELKKGRSLKYSIEEDLLNILPQDIIG
jgi:hypothetical protein